MFNFRLVSNVSDRRTITIDDICLNDFIDLRRKIIKPDPSTVSIVLAIRFGVMPSKSCGIVIIGLIHLKLKPY